MCSAYVIDEFFEDRVEVIDSGEVAKTDSQSYFRSFVDSCVVDSISGGTNKAIKALRDILSYLTGLYDRYSQIVEELELVRLSIQDFIRAASDYMIKSPSIKYEEAVLVVTSRRRRFDDEFLQSIFDASARLCEARDRLAAAIIGFNSKVAASRAEIEEAVCEIKASMVPDKKRRYSEIKSAAVEYMTAYHFGLFSKRVRIASGKRFNVETAIEEVRKDRPELFVDLPICNSYIRGRLERHEPKERKITQLVKAKITKLRPFAENGLVTFKGGKCAVYGL